MKIEAGKYYKTLDGRKAYVAGISPSSEFKADFPVVGWVIGHDSGPVTWSPDGKFHHWSSNHPCDLVSEWRELKSKTLYMFLLEGSGPGWLICVTALEPRGFGKILARKTVTITEGEGL